MWISSRLMNALWNIYQQCRNTFFTSVLHYKQQKKIRPNLKESLYFECHPAKIDQNHQRHSCLEIASKINSSWIFCLHRISMFSILNRKLLGFSLFKIDTDCFFVAIYAICSRTQCYLWTLCSRECDHSLLFLKSSA